MIHCIFIGGPTAVGKTAISLRLARHLQCPILSADSRQIYRELNIGVAKPSREELMEITHYGIGITSIHDPFSAGKYESYALEIIKEVSGNHNYMIIAGGTGLYLNSVLHGLDHFPEIPEEILDGLDREYKELGLPVLVEELIIKDPEYAAKADLDNSRRVIRALSVIRTCQKPYSAFLDQPKAQRPFKASGFYLDLPREILYQRINDRVDHMIEDGLLEEVKSLISFRNLKALQTVGYKELFKYLDGTDTLDKAIEEIKKNSRRYAKRQFTWFRNQFPFPGFHPADWDDVLIHLNIDQ